jgi:hypothetical protein
MFLGAWAVKKTTHSKSIQCKPIKKTIAWTIFEGHLQMPIHDPLQLCGVL